MTPASWPRPDPLRERLLHISPGSATIRDAQVRDLPQLLRPGDLLVVNDAATLPASLAARTPDGVQVEVRLLRHHSGPRFSAVLFGAGDWRTPTEHRPPPPLLPSGTILHIAPDLQAVIERVAELSARLIDLRFEPGYPLPVGGGPGGRELIDQDGAALWSALYRHGRPVQYAHLRAPLDLWRVQNSYGARPWAMESPSAGRPLTLGLLIDLMRAGVHVATLTHAAGLSATGDPALDAALPLPERYDIPAETVAAIESTKAAGGRVVAVGTTVVRALEGCHARHGRLLPGPGETDLRIGTSFHLEVIDGLLTGLHDPAASHFLLLSSFVPEPLLRRAYAHASRAGYQHHEFGDSNLILS